MTRFTKLSIFLALLTFPFVIKAQSVAGQSIQADTASYPYWIEMMQDQDANFHATQKAFNTYWEGREITKGSGYKPFKRWEYTMGQRVNPDGSRPAPDRNVRAYNTYIAKNGNRSTEGEWTSMGPATVPSGYNGYRGIGRVNAIAFHPTNPDKIYAGAPAGGLWISEDHGNTWVSYTDNLPSLGVSAIVVDHADPDVIYMGTGDCDHGDAPGLGVWKSFNGGLTWAAFNAGMPTSTISRMLMHPVNNNILLAAASGGVYKTTDGGVSWTKTISGNFKDIVFKPGNPDVIYATSGGSFYRSSDGGDTFTRITNGLPTGNRGAVGVSPVNPEIVYVFLTNSESFRGLYRSDDSGLTFTERSTSPNIMSWDCEGGSGGQAWYDLDMAVDPANADIIYGGGVNCFKSADGGSTWNIRSHWYGGCGVQSVHADLHVLEYSPLTGRLFAGNDGGVYWSDNGGISWTEVSNGLVISQAYKIGQSATNRNFVINGYQDNGTSTYTGTEWIAVGGGDGMECAFDPSDERYSYSTVYYGSINRIFENEAEGQIAGEGVNGITEGGDWVTPFLIDHNDGNTMFIGYKNIWRSNNIKTGNTSSVNWTKISEINTNNLTVMAQSRANSNILYAASGGSLYRSDNAKNDAVTWITITANLLIGNTITALETSKSDENTVYVVQQNRVFKSTDKGFNWIDITGTLPDVQMSSLVCYQNSSEGLYLGTDIGVFYRDKSMTDWILYSSGLPALAKITELEIFYDPAGPQGDVLRAGTFGRGLWESPLYFTTPTADFVADRTFVPVGCQVNFTDKTAGIPYSWSWTFEGADIPASTEQNPAGITWNLPGEYTVQLISTNPAGSGTEIKSAYIVVSDTLLPVVNFNSDARIFCDGEANVRFTDLTDFCPGSWLWEFTPADIIFTNGTSAASQNPEVRFNGTGNYTVKLTASNINGSSSLIMNNFIQFGGTMLPFNEDWESASLSANGWEVVNTDNKKTWEICQVQGTSPGNTAIRMDFFGYAVPPGPRDQLISPAFNLIGYNSAFLTFEHAYTRRYEQITDSLIVLVSEDCGTSWTRVWAIGEDGTGLFQTHPVSIISFTPESSADWCGAAGNPGCFLIDLSAWAGKNNVKIMFESVHRRGNGLFLDNISLTEMVSSAQHTLTENGFSVYPNPGKGPFVVESREWLTDSQLQMFAADGRIIFETRLEAGNHWTINQSNLARGIYFLRLTGNGKAGNIKLVVE